MGSLLFLGRSPAIKPDPGRCRLISLVCRPYQQSVENMLDVGQLQNHIQVLEQGDEVGSETGHSVVETYDGQESATAPDKVVRLLTSAPKSTSQRLTHPSVRQDAAKILGTIGPRSEPAIPQLDRIVAGGKP